MNRIRKAITEYPFVRNIILAVCAVIVFTFALSLMLSIFTRHDTHRTVPDFKGMQASQTARAARRASVRVQVVDSLYIPAYEPGTVLEQIPAPGTRVKAGRRIFLTVNSTHRKKVTVPYVTGFSLRQAKNNLEVAGLEIDKLVYREDMAINNVLEERYGSTVITPDTKLELEAGSGITLVVGLAGDNAQAVPRLVGSTLKEAKSRIWEVGLNVGKVEMDNDITLLNMAQAKVYSQSPDFPARVAYGSQVNIRLSLDQTKIDKGIDQSDGKARKVIQQQDDSVAAAIAPPAAKPAPAKPAAAKSALPATPAAKPAAQKDGKPVSPKR